MHTNSAGGGGGEGGGQFYDDIEGANADSNYTNIWLLQEISMRNWELKQTKIRPQKHRE